MPTTNQKCVRFAYKNQVIPSPQSWSTQVPPPLSRSLSTAPSSSAPVIAYPYGIPLAPSSSRQSVPAVYASRHMGMVRVHPYLAIDGIVWNLMDHPSMIIRKGHHLSSKALSEPAFEPILPFVSIVSSHLPWSFKVHASNGRYVSLEDVLFTIYRALRVNIIKPEFNSLASEERRKASNAYQTRYRRLRRSTEYEEEKRNGMKRVDFLLGHTRFWGLVNNGRRPDEWHLKVS